VSRRRIVTPKSVAETIEVDEKPFVSSGDVADRLDVTKQAVRNHHDELKESHLLEHGKVGRQTVFWQVEDETPAEVQETPSPPPETNHDRDVSGESKGILQRLFAGVPGFGSTPAEISHLLATIVAGLGLGVGLWLLVVSPPLAVQLLAVELYLLVGGSIGVGTGIYYALNRDADTVRSETRS